MQKGAIKLLLDLNAALIVFIPTAAISTKSIVSGSYKFPCRSV